MYYISLRLFGLEAMLTLEKGGDYYSVRERREGSIIIDLPFCSLILDNHRKASAPCSQGMP